MFSSAGFSLYLQVDSHDCGRYLLQGRRCDKRPGTWSAAVHRTQSFDAAVPVEEARRDDPRSTMELARFEHVGNRIPRARRQATSTDVGYHVHAAVDDPHVWALSRSFRSSRLRQLGFSSRPWAGSGRRGSAAAVSPEDSGFSYCPGKWWKAFAAIDFTPFATNPYTLWNNAKAKRSIRTPLCK